MDEPKGIYSIFILRKVMVVEAVEVAVVVVVAVGSKLLSLFNLFT
jgi:hypothetical protein